MNLLKGFFKNLPLQLGLCLVASLIIGPYLERARGPAFYTLSNAIKDVLIVVLPFIVFAYLFDALLGLDKKAPLLILTILVMVFLSSFTAVNVAYGVGQVFLPLLTPISDAMTGDGVRVIEPLFSLHLPQLLSADKAMFAGIIAGLVASFLKIEAAKPLGKTLHKAVTWFLHKTFIPLLPLYVTGFVLKLQYEGTLTVLIQNYIQVFLLAISLIISYLALLYYIGSGFRPKRMMEKVRNMIPAGVTGFSTMSSAATMPVTLESCEKNLKDPRFADLIVPSTVNIHLLGDALAIPRTGLALLYFKTGALPGLMTYLVFAAMFALTKFSTAGVPGGGVIVILPVLQTYLGLDQELISLMTTIYILQDCIFTSANVMGNGAFAMIVERVCRVLFGSNGGKHHPQGSFTDDFDDSEDLGTARLVVNEKR